MKRGKGDINAPYLAFAETPGQRIDNQTVMPRIGDRRQARTPSWR